MKKYPGISLLIFVFFLIGCGGSNKLRVPMAEIDRPLVNPKHTFSVKPSISGWFILSDSLAYKAVDFFPMLIPSTSYSMSNNISVSSDKNSNFLPRITWQLTKSPLVDSMARYGLQFAVTGTLIGTVSNWEPILAMLYKKRISPSIWCEGGVNGGYNRYRGILGYYCAMSNGLGFQLSPKSDVKIGLNIGYIHNSYVNGMTYVGEFDFHHSFSEWFGVNFGTTLGRNAIQGVIEGHSTSMGMSASGEFYW